jgi:hypothetical protein
VKPARIKRPSIWKKINELTTNSQHNNIRDVCRERSELKRSRHTRSNLMKGENGELLADTHKTLNMRDNYFDRLCGLMVRVPGYRSRGPVSIPTATRFSDK